jgi:translation initiation factor IF-3
LSRLYSRSSSHSQVRINGKIRAREVRVIDTDGRQLGILTLHEAIRAAQARGVDLVEVAPTAAPPVCRLIDYGKYLYEKSKEQRDSRKHHHAHKVKEVQLSASIDPHDFGIKLHHAIDFLCDEIKVKLTLKFRGREMAHTEIGFGVVNRFINELAPYGHPDADPKLVGKGLNVMISPLPRSKRGKNPHAQDGAGSPSQLKPDPINSQKPTPGHTGKVQTSDPETPSVAARAPPAAFVNNPFAKLDLTIRQDGPPDDATDS